MSSLISPIGDAEGNVRILIVGNTGSGKTTLGKRVSGILHIPHLSLDTVMFQPGWVERSRDEFRAQLGTYMRANKSWVIDGNYLSRASDLTQEAATNIIWLDPPFIQYFPRLVKRTILRLCGLGEPCSPGCVESFKMVFFSSDSILIWGWMGDEKLRKRYCPLCDQGGKWKRLGGWGREMQEWVEVIIAWSKNV